MDYSEKSYEELKRMEDRLTEEYQQIFGESAKQGLPWKEFCEKAHDVKEQLYYVSMYKRLKQDPVLTYNKDIGHGDKYEIEKFKALCEGGMFIDEDGFGEYATETAVSDIEIYPSDVTENLVRDDFTHVIWFNR